MDKLRDCGISKVDKIELFALNTNKVDCVI